MGCDWVRGKSSGLRSLLKRTGLSSDPFRRHGEIPPVTAMLTVGCSQTDGSIVSPTSKACVVGLKPTVGLVPNHGMIPLTLKQDVAGPIARTVKDAAHLLQALVERKNSEPIVDYAKSCASTELGGLRIGVPRASISSSDHILLDAFESALETLKSLGAVVVNNADFIAQEEFDGLSREEDIAMAGGFKEDIEAYLETLVENPRNLRTLGDLIEAMKADEREEYPTRGLEHFELSEKVDVASLEYKVALERNIYLAGEGGIGDCIKNYNPDVIAIFCHVGHGRHMRGSRWASTHHCTPRHLSQRHICEALPE